MFKNVFGKKEEKKAVAHPARGWKAGQEPEYKTKDGNVVVEDCGRDYRIMQEADFLKFRTFADESAGWNLKVEKNGIFVWDRPSQDKSKSGVNIIKLFAEFKGVDPKTMYDVLHDADYRPVWDTSMAEGYNLVHLDANNDVGYYHLKLPATVANRDFCNQRSWRNVDDKEYIIMNHSEPHEMCPPTKAVRGESIISGYFIRPHGTGCSITYVSQSDPKGWIPVMVLNSLLTSQAPNLVAKLQGASAEYSAWKKDHSPEDRPWVTPAQAWSTAQPNHTLAWVAQKMGVTLESIVGADHAEQHATLTTGAEKAAPAATEAPKEEAAPAAAAPTPEEEKKEEEEPKAEEKETDKEEEEKKEEAAAAAPAAEEKKDEA